MELEMRDIYKSFDSNKVLKGVDFNLSGGEICGLLGENGAGKSTLINILGGVINADSGSIVVDGAEKIFENPVSSMEAGIAFIHQELNLINDLTVYENMFIGREIKKKGGFLDTGEMIKRTEEVFEKLDMKLDPEIMVEKLDASYKQIVEIARALLMDASLIIMDEPTTSLTEPEIERVFNMMRNVREQGVGLIFISHKLQEVMDICDRYTVLRDGEVAASGDIKDVTAKDLARFMVGHDVRTESLRKEKKVAHSVLRADNISGASFRDISFDVKSGEILGVTGLLGDGRSELFLSIFGEGEKYTGDIFLEDKPVKLKSSMQAVEKGVAYLPRNRKENGILKDMNIIENASVVVWRGISKLGFIRQDEQDRLFDIQVKNLNIKMGSRTDIITSLSGGNQQKVMLAKWLSIGPKMLILDNPTKGVDVGAKEDIYDIILSLADAGVAVVVLSSEAKEIIRVCDRAVVMYHGGISGEVSGADMNEHNIMALATGAGTE